PPELQKAPNEQPKPILDNSYRSRANGRIATASDSRISGNKGPNRGEPEGPLQKEPPTNRASLDNSSHQAYSTPQQKINLNPTQAKGSQ
ncbi:hypothetical protein Ancab_038906, partial [Ancistrocladus abbreviatus]